MTQTRPDQVAVVDDDEAVLDSFRFVLELAGFSVTTYASAAAYMADIPAQARCLIVDYHMPVTTGLDLVASLRAKGIATPVLLVTSASSDDIVRRAGALGIDRVLDKPPTEDQLLGFVQACSGHQSRGAAGIAAR
jgi:two-component system response regulator FixJ